MHACSRDILYIIWEVLYLDLESYCRHQAKAALESNKYYYFRWFLQSLSPLLWLPLHCQEILNITWVW